MGTFLGGGTCNDGIFFSGVPGGREGGSVCYVLHPGKEVSLRGNEAGFFSSVTHFVVIWATRIGVSVSSMRRWTQSKCDFKKCAKSVC